MKRIFTFNIFLLFLFSVFSADLFSQETDRDSRFREDVLYLETLFPAFENSESEKKVFKYIKKRLEENFIYYSLQSLDTFRTRHSFNSNLVIDFPGETDKSFILAVPLNNYSENQYNIAAALYAADYFRQKPNRVNIKIIILGSEFSDSFQLGSETFLQDYYPEGKVSLLYLNMGTDTVKPEIIYSSITGNSPFRLVSQYLTSFEKYRFDFTIDTWKSILYKIGYDRKTLIDPYIRENIPSIYLRGSNLSDIEQLISIIEDAAIDEPDSLTEHEEDIREQNYLILNINDSYHIIREKTYLIFYITSVFLLLLFSVVFVKKFTRYLRIILRFSWIIAYLFALTFLFLFISTIAAGFLVSLKGNFEIWELTHLSLFSIKLLSGVAFLLSSLFMLKKISLPYSGSFYSSTAIFLSVINLVVFQFIDIFLSFLSLWILAWVFIFSFVKNRFFKSSCIVISQIFITGIIYKILIQPASNLSRMLLISPFAGNLLIAALLLPVVIMILRVTLTRPYHKTKKYLIIRRVIFSSILIITSFLYYNYYSKPLFDESNLQPVYVTKIINLDSNEISLDFKSPVSLGTINASIQHNNYYIDTDQTEYSVSSNSEINNLMLYNLIEIEKETSFFLDRKNLVFEIITPSKPLYAEISFVTDNIHIILDSNYPFTTGRDFIQGNLHIGINPPSPLVIDLLINRETVIYLEVSIVYENNAPFYTRYEGRNMIFHEKIVIIKTVNG